MRQEGLQFGVHSPAQCRALACVSALRPLSTVPACVRTMAGVGWGHCVGLHRNAAKSDFRALPSGTNSRRNKPSETNRQASNTRNTQGYTPNEHAMPSSCAQRPRGPQRLPQGIGKQVKVQSQVEPPGCRMFRVDPRGLIT